MGLEKEGFLKLGYDHYIRIEHLGPITSIVSFKMC